MSEQRASPRPARQGGPTRVWLFSAGLAAGAAVLFFTLVQHIPRPAGPFHVPWWVVAVMFALAEIYVVHLQFRRNAYSFGLTEIPLVIGLFFLSPQEIVLSQFIGAALALTLHRRQSLLKLVFNLSHFGLETCLAVMMFHAVIGSGGVFGPVGWAAAFLAAVATVLIGDVLVALAISLSEGELQVETLLQTLGVGVTITVTNTSLALICVMILWRDPWAAWLLTIPAVTLFIAYRAYTSERQKNESVEFLYESTRMLDQTPQIETALVSLLSHTRNMFRAEMAEVTLFPSGENESVLRTTLGPEDSLEVMKPVELALPEAEWTQDVLSERAVLMARPIQDQRLGAVLSVRGIRDAMLAPLRGETRIIGMMMVGNRLGDVSTFDHEDLRLFETLGNHVSISLENGRLEKSLAQLTELERQRTRLLDMAVQAAEEERSRLAAELHDGPIQRLAALGYGLERARRRLDRGDMVTGTELMGSLQEELSKEVRGLRRLMAHLRPPVLDESGLEAALSDYAHEFERSSGVTCTVDARLPSRLEPSHETVLYRLAQEALTNVGKHARATRANVTLHTQNGSVILRVTDDGVGFEPANLRGPIGGDHFGLAVMRERVEMVGGRWELQSRPGAGTTIIAAIPRTDGKARAPEDGESVWTRQEVGA